MASELITIPGHWDLHFDYAAGEVGSKFLLALRDDRRIMARRCPECDRALLPPRAFCDRCYMETTEWVEVGEVGVVEAFTIVYEEFDGLPPPPYAIAYVRLADSDTALANFVRNVEFDDPAAAARRLAIGRRMRVVWAQARHARITDFWYEPAEDG